MKTKLSILILLIFTYPVCSQTDKDYTSLAVAELRSGNYNGAIRYLDTLISLDKNNTDALSMRGYAKGQVEDYKGAMDDFNTIIKLDPKNSTAYDHRGICKKNLKDYKGAMADYNIAIQLNPENGEAYNNRAVVRYFFLADTIGACEDWQKSVDAGYSKANQIRKGKCPNPLVDEYKTKAMTEADFYKFVETNKLIFTIPAGFVKTEILANGDMPYNFAIKLKNEEFEARYYIEPITKISKSIRNSTELIDPNKFFLPFFKESTMNVSQSEPEIFRFETTDVENEFNTNIGIYSSFAAKSDYSGHYKYVHMMVFHKDDLADCYITFLWNEQAVCDENIVKVFHALKFVR